MASSSWELHVSRRIVTDTTRNGQLGGPVRGRVVPFRRNYSVRQYRSSRRPSGRKNLHRALISHAVFLARNLRPHYSAFISVLGRPPFVLSTSVLAFFFFSLFFFSLYFVLSFSSNLFCASAQYTRGNLSRRLDGFSAIFWLALPVIGRLPRPVMYAETFAPRPVIIHEGLKVASLKFQLLVFSFFSIRRGPRSCICAKIALARTISGRDMQWTAAVAKRLSAMMRVP